MQMNSSRRAYAVIAASGLIAAAIWVLGAPKRPEAAPAGPGAGLAAACAPGARTGRPNTDEISTADGLRITVRTPSDYDATRAYPLLVVYPPAGYDRRGSEVFYGLTTEATRRGLIVALSDHLPLSLAAASHQAKAAEAVAARFCVDSGKIAFLGHSDGGTIAEVVAAFAGEGGVAPRTIVASSAGVTREDLSAAACPSVSGVLIFHNRNDALFPDFGRGAAAYWGKCAACEPAHLDTLTEGCRQFTGCAPGKRVAYCETSAPHKRWPDVNTTALDFIQGGEAKSPH